MKIDFSVITILPQIISAFVGGLITYVFANRGKYKDIKIQKDKELKIILSDALVVYEYLRRLHVVLSLLEDKKDEMVFPKEFFPILMFKMELLNEACFDELEKSISSLKQLDSLVYSQLQGVGKRVNKVQKTLIVPFLKAKAKTSAGLGLSRTSLNELLSDVEYVLVDIARLISRKEAKRIKDEIDEVRKADITMNIEDINQFFYRFVFSFMPSEYGTMTYEDFINGTTKDKMKIWCVDELELLIGNDIEVVLQSIADNPDFDSEQIKALINQIK